MAGEDWDDADDYDALVAERDALQGERDAGLARAAEAEALTERLTAQIVETAAPLMAGHVNGDDAFACLAALAGAASVAAEAEARAVMLAAALREMLHQDDYQGGTLPSANQAAVKALAAGPGPLLALALIAVRCDSESHDWDSSDLGDLIDVVRTFPAWLHEYLTREAGDAEPR